MFFLHIRGDAGAGKSGDTENLRHPSKQNKPDWLQWFLYWWFGEVFRFGCPENWWNWFIMIYLSVFFLKTYHLSWFCGIAQVMFAPSVHRQQMSLFSIRDTEGWQEKLRSKTYRIHSWCGGFLKWWYPQIIHFNRVFHYKPSILGYPY